MDNRTVPVEYSTIYNLSKELGKIAGAKLLEYHYLLDPSSDITQSLKMLKNFTRMIKKILTRPDIPENQKFNVLGALFNEYLSGVNRMRASLLYPKAEGPQRTLQAEQQQKTVEKFNQIFREMSRLVNVSRELEELDTTSFV